MSIATTARPVCSLRFADLAALVDLYASVREAAWCQQWLEGLGDDEVNRRLDRLERNEGRVWRELALSQVTEARYGGDPDLAVYAAAYRLGLVPTSAGETAAEECAVLWSWRDQRDGQDLA